MFFFFHRFSAVYLGRASFKPYLMTGFTESVELGQIGEIKKNSAIVMRVQTGKQIAYDRLRWRGIALTNFDGRRGTTLDRDVQKLSTDFEGWIHTADLPPRTAAPSSGMIYTVYLEPLATDAIFVPGKVTKLRRNFTRESSNSFAVVRRSYLFRDSTHTLTNHLPTYTCIRYARYSPY